MRQIPIYLIGMFVISLLTACGGGDGTEEGPKESAFKNVKVYDYVTDMPRFPGGDEGLNRYIKKNLQYPEEAKSKGEEGVALVGFIIDSTGVVHEPKVENKVEDYFRDEALRLVNEMPKWDAGLNEGKPVNVRYVLPVEFELEK